MKISVIKLIARHEWRHIFRARAVTPVALVLGTTLLAASFISWHNAKMLNAERAQFQELVRQNWLEQPNRHPHRASHYGYLAFRPKSSLSFFDSGVDSYAGTSLFLEPHRQNTVNFSEARHSNGLLRFGELNLALILQLLVPLLIFFLGFAAVAGERESGVLALLLSQGVSWRELIVGKAAGILGVVFALLLPLLLLSLGLWLLLNDFRAGLDVWLRLALLLAGYGSYFVVCVALTLLVSALSRTSRGALTALLVVWILVWIVLPRAAQNLGAARYPTPSKSQFDKLLERDLAQEGDSHNPDDPKFAALQKEVLARYQVSDVKDLPFNYGGFVMGKAEEISSAIFRRHYGQLLEQFRRQNRTTELVGLLNPYLAVRHFSMAVAGSDFSAYESFGWQAEDFRFQMVQKLNALHTHEIKTEHDRTQQISRSNWQQFPQFNYREPTLGETLGRQSLALFSLLFWLAAAVAVISRLPARSGRVI